MEFLGLIGLVLFLGIMVGSIVAFINLSSISKLKKQITDLKALLNAQSYDIKKLQDKLSQAPATTPPKKPRNSNATLVQNLKPLENQYDIESRPKKDTGNTDIAALNVAVKSDNAFVEQKCDEARNSLQSNNDTNTNNTAQGNTSVIPPANTTKNKKENRTFDFNLDTFLAGNGLLWIGAVVLSLGGVFLAKYSIEAGLIPPYLRILAGVAFGVSLVVAAEYLHQHPKHFQINSEIISGALASAGVITCYAMTLVAFDFYDYLSPLLAFVILAIISISATWLSIRFGPILAAIGLIGAYIVPILVSTGSNNVQALLIYVALVSASTLWVYHIVRKEWLWWMSFSGHFLWLVTAIFISTLSDVGTLLGFALVSLYLYVIAPVLGWKCQTTYKEAMPMRTLLMPRKEQLGLLLSVSSMVGFYLFHGFDNNIYAVFMLLSLALFLTPTRHSAFDSWPFLSVLLAVFIVIKAPHYYDFTHNLFPFKGVLLFVQIACLVFTVYGYTMLKRFADRHSYLLLLVVSPLLLYALSYALMPTQAHEFLYIIWALELVIYAIAFIFFGIKASNILHKASFLILSNGAIALVLTMMLSAGTLTIALCLQVAIVSFITQKYTISLPN